MFQMQAWLTVKPGDVKIEDLSPNLARYAEGVLSERAGQVQRDARDNLARNGSIVTGALWRGIQVVHGGPTEYSVVVDREGTPMVPIYVEFGTVHAAAKPYFTPAVERSRQPFMYDDWRDLGSALVGRTRKQIGRDENSASAPGGGRTGRLSFRKLMGR